MCPNEADLNVPRRLESDSERSVFPCVRFVGLTTSLPMMLRDLLKVTELMLVSVRYMAESRVSWFTMHVFTYNALHLYIYIRSDQSLSHVCLFATPWITAHQASLSITNSRSSLEFMSIELVMPSSHLILCRPLLLLSPIPPSIRVFFQWVNSSHEVAKILEFQL